MNSSSNPSSRSDPIVGVGRRDNLLVWILRNRELLASPARAVRPILVRHPPEGDLNQPPARVFGHTRFRPLRRRGKERLLHGVLGGVEVSEPAQQGAEDLRRQVAQQVLGDGACGHRSSGGALITCRT